MIKKLVTHLRMQKIFNWLLAPICVMCGYYTQNSQNICDNCFNDLPHMPNSCFQCGQFLYGNANVSSKCGGCLKHSPDFDATYALFPYEWPITSFIIRLKFQHQLCYAQAFSELLLKKIKNVWYAKKTLPDLILPMPLHENRLRERGFNQALEIAKPIANILSIPIELKGIKRIKSTVPQKGLSRSLRKQNIANAFSVENNYNGLKIAILDDVITTGHTMREVSRILKKHGAERIDLWCCARRGGYPVI